MRYAVRDEAGAELGVRTTSGVRLRPGVRARAGVKARAGTWLGHAALPEAADRLERGGCRLPDARLGSGGWGLALVREAEARYGDEKVTVEVEAESGGSTLGAACGGALAEAGGGELAVEADALDPTGDEADALQDLGDEIAVLSAHISAATYRLLTLIAEFDRRGGWQAGGFRSCAEWLAFRTGVCKGAAREKVRTARVLVQLPKTSAEMAEGALSYAKVRAITRVATPDNEEELIELAHASTAEVLERVVRSWRRFDRLTEAEIEEQLHRSRRLVIWPDGEGMYEVRGRLDPEVGALLMRAIEAASDALWRDATDPYDTTSEQRRADAIALVAERAMAAGFGGAEDGAEDPDDLGDAEDPDDLGDARQPHDLGDAEDPDDLGDAEALDDLSGFEHADSGGGVSAETSGTASDATPAAGPDPEHDARPGTRPAARHRRAPKRLAAPFSGTQPERYQVVLHVEPETLRAGSDPGRSELEDGTRISAETARRLSCDASVVRMTTRTGPDGRSEVLDVGRRTRTIPPAIRRALDARDRGCRFPGCGCRFTAGHHLWHWTDGGPTALPNLVSLCRFHHRLVHEGRFRVEAGPTGRPNFYTPAGLPLPDVPPPVERAALLAEADAREREARQGGGGADDGTVRDAQFELADRLLKAQLRRGIRPRHDTGQARYRRQSDIPLSTTLAAMEAVARRE